MSRGTTRRPRNVVFIMTDQQRWDMLGCYGSPWMHTPNLDRLAAEGCRFDAAYTTTPVCTPARAALFTGMYGSSSGAMANQLSPHRHVLRLGEMTGGAGVPAGYIGKWHLDGPGGGYYGLGVPDGGFDPEYWYDGRRFIEDAGEEGFKKWREGEGLTDSDCWGTRVADRAIRFIEAHRDRGPFFLVASFDEPHGPSSAPRRFYDLYKGSTRPWRPNMADTLEGKPATHEAVFRAWGGRGRVPDNEPLNNGPRYYGCTTFVDEQIGRVVDAVDRLCAEDTAVIFTVDHGDHHGAHGLLGKGMTMYEETTRVPLIVRAPGLTAPGSVCRSLVSHINLPPTFFRLLGLEPHEQLQGGDAMPLLADPSAEIGDAVFMEFNRFGLPHSHFWGFVPIRCIRTARHKLVLNLVDTDELYDLQADPGEIDNRIDDPALAEVRDELHDRILAWQEQRRDPMRGRGWYNRAWRAGYEPEPSWEK